MLGHQKFVFNLCLCNKVPYDTNGVLLLLYVLYFFWICVYLHMLCIKVYRKTSVWETHRDNMTEFDREIHEIQKATEQKQCSPKLDRNRPVTALHRLALRPQSGSSPIHFILYGSLSISKPNWKSLNKTTIKLEERLIILVMT